MSLILAAVLGIAIAVTQILWAGALPIYSSPGFLLTGVAGLMSVLLLAKRRVSPDRICCSIAVTFAAYIVTRAATSPVAYLARADILCVLACLVVYLIFALYVTEPGPRLVFLGVLMVMIVVNVVIGLIHFFKDPSFTLFGLPRPAGYRNRASGLFICPNHFAGFLEMAGVFALSLTFWSRLGPMLKMLCLYAAIVAFGGVLVSGSRGAYLAALGSVSVLGAATVVLVHVLAPHHALRTWVIGGVAAVALGVGVLVALQKSSLLQERGQNLTNTEDVRIRYWGAALRQFQTAPMLGAGARSYMYLGRTHRDPAIQGDPIFAHNDYLQLLAEYGMIGAVFGLAVLGAHFVRCVASIVTIVRDRLLTSTAVLSHGLAIQLGSLCALAAITIHSVFDFNLHIPANALFVAAILGMIANTGIPFNRGAPRPQRGRLLRLLVPAVSLVMLVMLIPRIGFELLAERARVELKHGSPKLASVYGGEALKKEPNHPATAWVFGEAQRLLAHKETHPRVKFYYFESAVRAFRNGLDGNPYDVHLWLYLGRTYDELGRFDEAGGALAKAIALDPNSYFVYEHLGLHEEAQGHDEAAAAYFRKALTLLSSPVSQQGLANALERRKRTGQDTAPQP